MRSGIPEPEEYRGVYRTRWREAGYGLYSSLGIDFISDSVASLMSNVTSR